MMTKQSTPDLPLTPTLPTHSNPVQFQLQLCNGHRASTLMDIRKKGKNKMISTKTEISQSWKNESWQSFYPHSARLVTHDQSGEPGGCRSASEETIIAIISNAVQLNRPKSRAEEKYVIIS